MALSLRHAAKALIVSTKNPEEILLIKERLPSGSIIYDLPGGKIEPGETPQEALKRELLEELSIEVEIGKKIGTYEFVRAYKPAQVICQTYLCRFDPNKPIDVSKNPAPNENILAAEWMTLKNILTNKPPEIGPGLMKLFASL